MLTEISDENQLSVLVVDDDQATSRLIRQNLEGKGTRVIEAASGFDCIKILQQAKVDLVLLDFKLSDLNGWGILSLLRLTEQLRDIPVIMLSADPPSPTLVKQFGPDDYIQKPFDMRDLLVRMKKVLDSRYAKH